MEETFVLHEVLPVEVILHVFSCLPPKGVLQAEAVCRSWREIANSEWLWERVQKKTFGQGPNRGGGGEGKDKKLSWRERCIRNARTWKRLIHEFQAEKQGESCWELKASALFRWASACGLEQVIAELLERDDLPTKKLLELSGGELFLAIRSGNAKAVELLAHAGANLNILDGNSRSPIGLAATLGSLDIVEVTLFP